MTSEKNEPEISIDESTVLDLDNIAPKETKSKLEGFEIEEDLVDEDGDSEINNIREEIAEWHASEDEAAQDAPVEKPILPKAEMGDDLFLKRLPQVYQKRSTQLDQYLKKDLAVIVEHRNYYLSFSANELTVTKEAKKAETTVTLSGDTLDRLLNGQINPQIALLNNKISIQGNFNTGLFFFNLLDI